MAAKKKPMTPSATSSTRSRPKFLPNDPASKMLQKRRSVIAKKLRADAPKLKAWLDNLNQAPETEEA